MTWRSQLEELSAQVWAEVDRLGRTVRSQNTTALAAFVRPELGATPAPLKRFLEPLVAALALSALVGLGAFGMVGFATLFLAASLIYLIITKVFGIELGLGLDPGAAA